MALRIDHLTATFSLLLLRHGGLRPVGQILRLVVSARVEVLAVGGAARDAAAASGSVAGDAVVVGWRRVLMVEGLLLAVLEQTDDARQEDGGQKQDFLDGQHAEQDGDQQHLQLEELEQDQQGQQQLQLLLLATTFWKNRKQNKKLIWNEEIL